MNFLRKLLPSREPAVHQATAYHSERNVIKPAFQDGLANGIHCFSDVQVHRIESKVTCNMVKVVDEHRIVVIQHALESHRGAPTVFACLYDLLLEVVCKVPLNHTGDEPEILDFEVCPTPDNQNALYVFTIGKDTAVCICRILLSSSGPDPGQDPISMKSISDIRSGRPLKLRRIQPIASDSKAILLAVAHCDRFVALKYQPNPEILDQQELNLMSQRDVDIVEVLDFTEHIVFITQYSLYFYTKKINVLDEGETNLDKAHRHFVGMKTNQVNLSIYMNTYYTSACALTDGRFAVGLRNNEIHIHSTSSSVKDSEPQQLHLFKVFETPIRNLKFIPSKNLVTCTTGSAIHVVPLRHLHSPELDQHYTTKYDFDVDSTGIIPACGLLIVHLKTDTRPKTSILKVLNLRYFKDGSASHPSSARSYGTLKLHDPGIIKSVVALPRGLVTIDEGGMMIVTRNTEDVLMSYAASLHSKAELASRQPQTSL